jgi:hypothetical protein
LERLSIDTGISLSLAIDLAVKLTLAGLVKSVDRRPDAMRIHSAIVEHPCSTLTA